MATDCEHKAMRAELTRRGYCRYDAVKGHSETWLRRHPGWGQCVLTFRLRTSAWGGKGTFAITTAVGGHFEGRTPAELRTALDGVDSLIPPTFFDNHVRVDSIN